MAKGLAFWRKDDDGDCFHARFVISEPDYDNQILIVHMTTWRNTGREESTCILEPGEHPSVRDKSYIRYDGAFDIDYFQLLQEKAQGLIEMLADLPLKTLSKIQDGARNSNALEGKYKKYFDYF